MTDSEPRGLTVDQAVDEFLATKHGNYRANLATAIERWRDWLGDDEPDQLEDVATLTMKEYAAHLATEARRGEIGASTARTYYHNVSALFGWAFDYEHIPTNPAAKERATSELPEPDTDSSDQQFWSPAQRAAVTEYVDAQARAAIEDDGSDAFAPVRDRALVFVLAYSGVRGSELLADHRDERRDGVTWTDVDLDNGTLTVLGKSKQGPEAVGLPEQTLPPLRRLRTLVDPPTDDWPVFPSRHAPSLYERIEKADHDRPDGDPVAYCHEHGIAPPSMTVSGARSLLQRLSDAADVPDLDADEYLTLHGARRGVGETLYREFGAQRAQRTLRHQDPKTTSKMYSHIEASELGQDNTEAFENE